MKKLYIAPEMEIKKFSVEDIMTASSATVDPTYNNGNVTGGDTNVVASVEYSDLFDL